MEVTISSMNRPHMDRGARRRFGCARSAPALRAWAFVPFPKANGLPWSLDIFDKSRSDARMVAVGFSPRFGVIFHLASRSDARSGGEYVIHKPGTDRFKRRSATHLGGA